MFHSNGSWVPQPYDCLINRSNDTGHLSHRSCVTVPTRSNAVLAPMTRCRRNMKFSLDVQSEPKKLPLLAPTRHQHDSPQRRASERVLILSMGAFPQFGFWNLHLKCSLGSAVGEPKLHDSTTPTFSKAVLDCTLFSCDQSIRNIGGWRLTTRHCERSGLPEKVLTVTP